ncbi:hypothetical protein O181_081965 [Austropuccinia psidii MF-1]|uniref:Uncharacterized protein n=1 Tax=Austropuccinia psidii MF-1 TaxID=1389203 RepID=A0A9Q3FK24_9BASI|nr:hypothetical protein [Austropuccinia psidii MF-1]
MRQDHGKNSWPWWKEQIFSKWANDSWRFKMENSFEAAIFNIERDRPMSLFLKQKDRLTALQPDMSETMAHKRILRKCGGDLGHSIRSRCIEPCSTEYYINSMEDITTRKEIGINWTIINAIEIGKAEEKKGTDDVSLHESYSEPSEEELPYKLSIENINVSFEVTEVHTNLAQYSDECMDLIHVQDASM